MAFPTSFSTVTFPCFIAGCAANSVIAPAIKSIINRSILMGWYIYINNVYMNDFWSTLNTSMIAQGRQQPEVSASDISSLLKKRTDTMVHSEDDLKELQDYCQRRGILGLNFNGMNPRAVLQMLKNKTGDRTPINETKKVLLYG
jgi:hypothetical protein